VALLPAAGANPDSIDKEEQTAMSMVGKYSYSRIVPSPLADLMVNGDKAIYWILTIQSRHIGG
jgi:hypothetical protein